MVAQTEKSPVEIGPDGLSLDDGAGNRVALPFVSGAVHYYHLPKSKWGRCLDAAASLGLPMVETYVPWAVHEMGPGKYNFERGDGRFERDLGHFLDECAARDLKVFVRPGPHINGELTGFGYPWRVLRNRDCLAVGAKGNNVVLPTPPRFFSVPSYASHRFMDESNQWLCGVAEFLKPYVWPNGPVVITQVDNEMAFFFRTGAYDQDYHPDSIAAYRDYLSQKYGADLPQQYKAKADFIDPPRKFDAKDAQDLLWHLDWVRFKEWFIVKTLGKLKRILVDAGLGGIPFIHNFPGTQFGEACSFSAAETEVDIAGIDLYLRCRSYTAVKRITSLAAAVSRLPVFPELAWGTWPWWFPQSPEDQLSSALTGLMHGAKGLNLYMLVDRDRWIGAPIGKDGKPHEDLYEKTRELVNAVMKSHVASLSNPVDVAVMEVRDYRRLALCSSMVDPVSPMLLSVFDVGPKEVCSKETFGLSCPVQVEQVRFVEAAESALDGLHVNYRLVDSDASLTVLTQFKLLVVPVFDFFDRAVLEKLRHFVEGGGVLVVGPRLPHLDETMAELNEDFPTHVLCHEDELEIVLEEITDRFPSKTGAKADAPEVDVVTYKREKGEAVLFVANKGERSCTTSIHGEALKGMWVTECLTGDPVNLDCLNLQSQQVRMFCCSSQSKDGCASCSCNEDTDRSDEKGLSNKKGTGP